MPSPPKVLFVVLLGCAALGATAQDAPAPAAAKTPFNVLGPADAPVTVFEFSDLQCPYCARFTERTFPQLRRNYVATGKLRYIVRDLPLSSHAFAVPAAVAARCAGEQGRFWEYRAALFGAQADLGKEPYARIGRRLGLDVERLESCRRDGRQAAKVQADAEFARSQGISGTPTFVIGRAVDGKFQGEAIPGALTYEEFAARIDALLPAGR
jgi:protein-disulfide isomerase